MPTDRKSRAPKTIYKNKAFEEYVTATLEAQDRMFERLEKKLEKPALNGGFDALVEKVEKIERVTEKLHDCNESTSKKVHEIHAVVLDPDKGLYHVVKANTAWIGNVKKGLRWFGGLAAAGLLTGVGKLLYDVLTKHIHFMP